VGPVVLALVGLKGNALARHNRVLNNVVRDDLGRDSRLPLTREGPAYEFPGFCALVDGVQKLAHLAFEFGLCVHKSALVLVHQLVLEQQISRVVHLNILVLTLPYQIPQFIRFIQQLFQCRQLLFVVDFRRMFILNFQVLQSLRFSFTK